jgi:hypothetical protein
LWFAPRPGCSPIIPDLSTITYLYENISTFQERPQSAAKDILSVFIGVTSALICGKMYCPLILYFVRVASLIKSDGRGKPVPPMAGLGRWKKQIFKMVNTPRFRARRSPLSPLSLRLPSPLCLSYGPTLIERQTT